MQLRVGIESMNPSRTFSNSVLHLVALPFEGNPSAEIFGQADQAGQPNAAAAANRTGHRVGAAYGKSPVSTNFLGGLLMWYRLANKKLDAGAFGVAPSSGSRASTSNAAKAASDSQRRTLGKMLWEQIRIPSSSLRDGRIPLRNPIVEANR
jgi:hypothetical protein